MARWYGENCDKFCAEENSLVENSCKDIEGSESGRGDSRGVKINYLWFIIGGAVIVLLVIFSIIFVIRRRRKSFAKPHAILSRQNSRSPLAMENYGANFESRSNTNATNGSRTTIVQADVIVTENPLYEEFKTSNMWFWAVSWTKG